MLQDGPESWRVFRLCKSVGPIESRWDVTDVRYLVIFEGLPCERYIKHQPLFRGIGSSFECIE
jgi:hypothetical protein